MSETRRAAYCGISGTIVGFLALALALFHFYHGPLKTTPPPEEAIADTVVSIKEAVVARIKGEKVAPAPTPPARRFDPDDALRFAVTGLGLLSLVLAAIAFIRREDWRATTVALAVGGGALAFQFVAMLALMAIGLVFLFLVLNVVGLS